jgi:undecaprenyl-diphosphatase
MDRTVSQLLNRIAQHEPLRLVALLSAKYLVVAPVLVVVGLGLSALRRRDTRSVAYLAITAVGTAGALGINQLVGHVFFRLRPYLAISSVHAIGTRGGDSSFFSDHTALVTGLTFGAFFVSRRWGWISLAGAVLVGFGRIAVGAHYPSDLVVAAVVGCATVAVLLPLRHRVERLASRLPGFRNTSVAPPHQHERHWQRIALLALALLVGWVAGRLQDHGLHTALSRAEGRIHGTIPSDARLYKQTDIEMIAAGRWRASRARVYGTVTYVTREPDGDVHVILKAPDRSFIVLEITPEIPMQAPHDDDKITAWGVVRHDGLHNWWELHPLTGWRYGHVTTPTVGGLDD